MIWKSACNLWPKFSSQIIAMFGGTVNKETYLSAADGEGGIDNALHGQGECGSYEIHLTNDSVLGSYEWKGKRDLLNIVMIGLADELLGHDEKLNIIGTEYDILIEDCKVQFLWIY